MGTPDVNFRWFKCKGVGEVLECDAGPQITQVCSGCSDQPLKRENMFTVCVIFKITLIWKICYSRRKIFEYPTQAEQQRQIQTSEDVYISVKLCGVFLLTCMMLEHNRNASVSLNALYKQALRLRPAMNWDLLEPQDTSVTLITMGWRCCPEREKSFHVECLLKDVKFAALLKSFVWLYMVGFSFYKNNGLQV